MSQLFLNINAKNLRRISSTIPSKQNQGVEELKLRGSQDEWERWGEEGEDESRARTAHGSGTREAQRDD
jgi:hypothetical protein